MKGLTLLVGFLFVIGRCRSEYLYDDCQLAPAESKTFESPNYPAPAPEDLNFIITARTTPNAVLVLTCEDLWTSEEEPCDHGLQIIDGAYRKTLCGRSNGDFKYIAESGGLYLSYTTPPGPGHESRLRCRIKSVSRKHLGEEGNVETSTNAWSYLDWSQEEIDSSEFGGPRGRVGTTCQCGWANRKGGRVYNGRETGKNEFPFMAGLTYLDQLFVFCGGSIITPYHILTAAHCINGRTADGLGVVIGAHDLLSETDTGYRETVRVKQCIPHPNYNKNNHLNDIGVLALERRISFYKLVGPVCLPQAPLKLDLEYVTVIGWGESNKHPGTFPPLQKTRVRILSKPHCHKHRPFHIPEGSPNQLCVYARNTSSCFGDSGGPLVWRDPDTNMYTVVGLVSYGDTDCANDRPRVVTDVSTYLEWIQQMIKASNPSGVSCTKVE